MKNTLKRGSSFACFVFLIIIMIFFEGSHGMTGMIYHGVIFTIMVILGADIISDVYLLFKNLEAIIISPRIIIMLLISVGSLLYGMQGLWNVVMDVREGPVTFTVKQTDISLDQDDGFFHLTSDTVAVIDYGETISKIPVSERDQYELSRIPMEADVTISYWVHTETINIISFQTNQKEEIFDTENDMSL